MGDMGEGAGWVVAEEPSRSVLGETRRHFYLRFKDSRVEIL